MSFNLNSYLNTVKKAVRADAPKLREAAGDALYYALCTAPLLALGQLGSEKEIIAGAVALVGSVGGNLLANVAQKVKDDGRYLAEVAIQVQNTPPKQQAAIIAAAVNANPDFQDQLDGVLKQLNVIEVAIAAQLAANKSWFSDTLQKQLEQLGSGLRIETQGGAVVMREVNTQGGAFIGRDQINYINHIYGDANAPTATDYLNQLRNKCNRLPLMKTQTRTHNPNALRYDDLKLNDVYVMLNTTTSLRHALQARQLGLEKRDDMGDKTRPLTVREAVIGSARVILHGKPGSGKSAFISQLAADIASAQLNESRLKGGATVMTKLCPIIVNLRSLAQHLKQEIDPAEWRRMSLAKRESIFNDALWAQWRADLKNIQVEGFESGLRRKLLDGNVLLIFDGLDEVTPALRDRVRDCVRYAVDDAFANKPRVIVTMRTRSFTPDLFHDFVAYELADFNEAQIRTFTSRWYWQQPHSRLSDDEKRVKAADFEQAALKLINIAKNPLMLTVMAFVHQQKKLPDQRVLLFKDIIDMFFERWHDARGVELTPEMQILLEKRGWLSALRHLAYEAHNHQAQIANLKINKDTPAAELTGEAVLKLLVTEGYMTEPEAHTFLNHIDHTAGLFSGNGGIDAKAQTYSFPHRQFQEYLAGCFLAFPQPDDERSKELYREKLALADYWEEAARLGAEYQLHDTDHVNRWRRLVYYLCPPSDLETESDWRGVLWSANFALDDKAKIENDLASIRDPARKGGTAYLERVRRNLLTIMRQRKLPAKERAAAGRALAKLGDPRREVTTVEAMRWVCIPKGPFIRGSDKNHDAEKLQMRVNVDDDYYLSQYPVTQAQYGQFVAAQGYAEPRWWGEAKEAGYWQADKGFKGRYEGDFRTAPRHYGEPFSLPNHPVVGVSWYEAVAFIRWLNEEVKNDRFVLHDYQAKPLTGKFEIRLPSETEWEKAARGTKDARAYGWGDTPNPDLANYDQTGLGATSAVGCFPNGDAHEFAVEEMSGNVREWCITPWQSSYKDYDDAKNIKNSKFNILRGGSWINFDDFLRVSSRDSRDPDYHGYYYGFRLLALPIF